jgi:hypothetical protein
MQMHGGAAPGFLPNAALPSLQKTLKVELRLLRHRVD